MWHLFILHRLHHNLVHIQFYAWWHPLHSCALFYVHDFHNGSAAHIPSGCVAGSCVCVGVGWWAEGGGGDLSACPHTCLFASVCLKGPTWLGCVLFTATCVCFLGIHYTPSPLRWLAWHLTCTHTHTPTHTLTQFCKVTTFSPCR